MKVNPHLSPPVLNFSSSASITTNTIHHMDVLDLLNSIKGENLIDMAIIDPPYNIGKNFGNNYDNKDIEDYINWSITYLNECWRLVKPSSPIYIYGYPEILAHLAVHYPLDKQRWLVWHYTNKTVPSSKFWQRSYESILCLWKDNKPSLQIDDIREEYTEGFLKNAAGKTRKSKECRYSKGNSITIYQAHEKGALPRDVIKTPALAGGTGYSERIFYCRDCDEICFNTEKEKHLDCKVEYHPTQKPMKLTEKLIKGTAPKNILIPFAGSGSECVVAQGLGVDFYSTDINKDYVTLGNKWLQKIKKNNSQSSLSFQQRF